MLFKKLILIFFIFISYSKCKEESISFQVKSIELSQVSCFPSLGTYLFYIKGEFSEPPEITSVISFNLESHPNLKVICYPLEKTSVTIDQLQCEINMCDYALNNENITLPVNPPNINGYNFINWKEFIGSNPGVSNKIPEDNITCIPKELNSYIISSLECSDIKNNILIKGKWSDESNLIPSEFSIKIKNNNIANCKPTNQNDIKCEINGQREVKFDEKYFKSGINVYKIEKSDASIKVDQCNFSSFLIFSRIFIILVALLL